MTTHSHLTDMEYKKLVKLDPKKSTTLAKKEAASLSFKDLPSIVFLSSSDYNIFGSLIADLRQEILKVSNNYPRNVTSAYDMLTHFELESPRRHHTERTGDKRNRENHGGCGGRDHTFVQHTTPYVTVFISGIDSRTSYLIKCFNCEKWGY